jgi:hypothetical protein
MRYVREPTWEEDDDLLAFSTPRNRNSIGAFRARVRGGPLQDWAPAPRCDPPRPLPPPPCLPSLVHHVRGD